MNAAVTPTAPRVRSATSIRLIWMLFGLAAAIKINIVGEIYIGEVLAIVALPFLLLKRKIDRNLAWTLGFAVLWSVGQLTSDLFNETDINSMLKGVGAPIVFAGTICVVSILLGRHPDRIASFLLGAALALLVKVIVAPTPYQLVEPWKWGYGPAALAIGLVWFSFFWRVRPAWLTALALAFSLACIVASARSLAMVPIAGLMAYLFWNSNAGRPLKLWLTGRAGALKAILLLFVLATLLNAALTLFFASGVLDPFLDAEVAGKYRGQASADVGLLLAGRSESLIAVRAFLDSPLIGHGSWAQDKSGYLAEYAALQYQYGISDTDIPEETDSLLIPAHSYLFGALVWAGFIGGVFWIALFSRIANQYLTFARQLPLYFHVGIVSFLWNVLFSPFGADSRWLEAIFIASLFAYCRALSKKAI